jgi:hypothetical protein
MKVHPVVFAALVLAHCDGAIAQTYSNGPLVTHPGGGFGGADASTVQNVSPLFLSSFGYGGQSNANNRLADDFVVPAGQAWLVTQIRIFGYQTQTTPSTTSTMTGGNYRIWTAAPNAGGAVLHDHSGTNQMTSTDFGTNTYRVAASPATPGLLANNRPVFRIAMSGNGIVLPAGTYWLDFAATGSLASGPFFPPISIWNQATTGNAVQALAGVWGAFPITSGGSFAQGLPFEIDYTLVPVFDLTISQPGGAGFGIVLADTNGAPGNTAVNVVTLAPGAFPDGWLFGVDIDVAGLASLVSTGPPFLVTLGAAGDYTFGPLAPPPFPLPIWYVGIELAAGSGLVVGHSIAKTVTIMP